MISQIVAAFGDAALLLPASLLLLVYLLALREPRLALSFGLAIAIAGGATLLAKLAFHACGGAVPQFDVTSPSGHTSFTTIFYGSIAVMLGTGRPAWFRWSGAAATMMLIVAVGISRVRTGAHSPAEVAIGIAIGSVALALFTGLHRWSGAPTLPWLPVGIGFAVAVIVLGGAHFSLEHRIGSMARALSATFDICAEPFASRREPESGGTLGLLSTLR